MLEQRAIQKLLHETLISTQLKNPAFSVRALAKKLGMQASAVSEIIKGKRKISVKLARRIAEKLSLSPKETQSLLSLFNVESSDAKVDSSVEIANEQFFVISEWYHFAILSLAETTRFKSEPQWIAQRLNIKVSEAQEALDRLVHLGMLIYKNKKYQLTGEQFKTQDGVSHVAIRKSHHQSLDRAKQSLDNDSVALRDMFSMTLSMDVEQLPEARQLIRKFANQLTHLLESSPRKNEVYKLGIQLFPLTQVEGGSYELN